MNRTLIATSLAFALVSYGNGAAYNLSHAGHSVFVKGEDAAQLVEDLESIRANFPQASAEHNLARLWSIYEEQAEPDRSLQLTA